jgi:NAD-dependent SIR2 family protein deacetylase
VDGVVTGRLGELVDRGGVCVLSGAGLSTDSGIPDYRGPSGALRARLPMTIAEFRGSPEARQRYWARAHIGWRRIAAARPNAAHRAVAAMQQAGALHGIITQNVDGLHQAAGARDVLELHGTLDCVVCLECGARSTREALDQRLRTANPNLGSDAVPASNPDGDAELADDRVARFRVVGCECCGADLLKPDVVFFGENVPRRTKRSPDITVSEDPSTSRQAESSSRSKHRCTRGRGTFSPKNTTSGLSRSAPQPGRLTSRSAARHGTCSAPLPSQGRSVASWSRARSGSCMAGRPAASDTA